MRAFLAERSPPIEGPVAAKVRHEFSAFVAQHAGRVERHRGVEAELVERSRHAIAQSFAILAKLPDTVDRGFGSDARERAATRRGAAGVRPSRWQGLLTEGDGDRFFFDVDDGERKRCDAVGMVLPHRDDVPRETKAVLFDLAYAEIPRGRPRLFIVKVRDARGAVIYKGSMTMKPLPTD